jgi:hypothetical protein
MFARAINDPNPIYSDEDYARKSEVGGVIAPPTFTQASAQFDPEYFLRPKIGQPWFGSAKEPTGIKPRAASGGGSGGPSSGAAAGGLHAEQHFEYHRPLLAGMVLTAVNKPGKSWEKEGNAAASCTSPSRSPSTATRTAIWSSRPAAWACAPSA